MRTLIFFALCILSTACSRHLEVRVFNASGTSLTACSFDQKPTECIEISNGSSAVLKWRQGTFAVQIAGCSVVYQAPIVESLEEFRANPQEPVNVAINRDHLFLLVRNGHPPEGVTSAGQPPGFPVAPYPEQAACK